MNSICHKYLFGRPVNTVCLTYMLIYPSYLTYIQSTSCKMLAWMRHKLESRLLGEISITSDMEMTPYIWQKVKRS